MNCLLLPLFLSLSTRVRWTVFFSPPLSLFLHGWDELSSSPPFSLSTRVRWTVLFFLLLLLSLSFYTGEMNFPERGSSHASGARHSGTARLAKWLPPESVCVCVCVRLRVCVCLCVLSTFTSVDVYICLYVCVLLGLRLLGFSGAVPYVLHGALHSAAALVPDYAAPTSGFPASGAVLLWQEAWDWDLPASAYQPTLASTSTHRHHQRRERQVRWPGGWFFSGHFLI